MSEPRVSEQDRCAECGSWGVRCASDKPVQGCGCARCLAAALDTVRAARQAAEQRAERWKREAMARRNVDWHETSIARTANEAAEREDAARGEQDK